MDDKKIEIHLSNAIEEAPIDLLDAIKNEPVTRMPEHDHITSQEAGKRERRFFTPLVSAASLVAVFVFGYLGWFMQFQTVDTIVFFDCNPSIEISTNKQNQVIGLEGLNKEGEELVADIRFQKKEIKTVTLELLKELVEEGYINTQHNTILLSILHDDKERSTEQIVLLNDTIQEYLNQQRIEPVILKQTLEKSSTIQAFAEKNHISLGRMTFIRNLIVLNPGFTTEKLASLSLEDLIMLSRKKGLDLSRIIDIDKNDLQYIEDVFSKPKEPTNRINPPEEDDDDSDDDGRENNKDDDDSENDEKKDIDRDENDDDQEDDDQEDDDDQKDDDDDHEDDDD